MDDYYSVLSVSPHARLPEIRKAYRTLALKQHPDKDPTNPAAKERFQKLTEAWQILGNEQTRKKYDYERWKAGLAALPADTPEVTPDLLLHFARELNESLARMDEKSLNREALAAYLLLILHRGHTAVLKTPAGQAVMPALVSSLLHSVGALPYPLALPVLEEITLLTGALPELARKVANVKTQKRKQHLIQRLRPLIIVLITIALCAFIYWWAQ